jgi:hypothetical protein
MPRNLAFFDDVASVCKKMCLDLHYKYKRIAIIRGEIFSQGWGKNGAVLK